jgi:hypothetical protein
MRLLSVFLSILFLFHGLQVQAWGFWAHKRLNRLAIFTLPPEMIRFYKFHMDYITEHAVDPDSRRYMVEGEAENHYIDVDHYDVYPFNNVPRTWKEAVNKFSEDTLRSYGIVPWHLQVMMGRLTAAFRSKDVKRILKVSTDLGHYVGDSNVPLHTTENYNGQMSGQYGIHGFWESRLPEMYGDTYNYFVGKAVYIEDPLEEAWKTVFESHIALDSVFGFERKLTQQFGADRKYGYENRNNVLTKVYSRDFSKAYHDALAGQVERRMRTTIYRIGSYWYTAWVNAGQPNLDELLKPDKKGGQVILPEEDQEQQPAKKLNIIDREASLYMRPSHLDDWYSCCMNHAMAHGYCPKTPLDHDHHDHQSLDPDYKPNPLIAAWDAVVQYVKSVFV